MRTIQLLQLILTNFKGIRSKTIRFDHVTDIYGDNATGKTSIMDAFLWLLFGKDSTDRKDFEIKTLDGQGNPYHRLDHEVEAVLKIDGEQITIKRSLREKWVKKRGSIDTEFSGHETTFFWNDVPLKESDYLKKVSEIMNENLFKLITNTGYFNSLKWQDRRNVLMQMAGTISNDDVLDSIMTPSNKGQFAALINALNAKKTISEYKAEISNKKRKIKEEIILIPSRIDEANRSLPDPVDYTAVEKSLEEARKSLQEVEESLMDITRQQKAEQEGFNNTLQEIQRMKMAAKDIEFTARNTVKDRYQARVQNLLDLKRKQQALENQKSSLASQYITEERKKTELQKEQAAKRIYWNEVNNEQLVFDEHEFSCPTCKRAYDDSDIEAKKQEFTKNFNESKSSRLSAITERGKKIGEEIAAIDAKLGNIHAENEKINQEITTVEETIREFSKEHERLSESEENEVLEVLKADANYNKTLAAITQLEEKVNAPRQGTNNTDLLDRKRALTEIIALNEKQLNTKEQRNKTLARIAELEKQESEQAQELAKLEGIEYSITQFEKAQMDVLENRINGKFKLVSFKLFETQINGGEVPCCITLVNGVPYPDANTASKTQAGIDIINALSAHFGVQGPVFIDNRESTIEIPETSAQIINLRVVEGAKLSVGNIEWMPGFKQAKQLEIA